ncbi:energy transducer TonB [Photobacterium leiognathi]|uniref:Energy transducer TonB n=1 Tax=Photobacterium leiognathi subsp. mandapamensis TaxID=48408 RepID=A0A2T3KUZ9_PHOLD|nr:energy transducer TonB [Photobacterium leiognathi]PSV10792.1 energy transducer TonB [Photobacterium leiognathi subsp. mandapamensis]
MNLKRYAIAGSASILFHSLLVSAMPDKKIITVPVSEPASVSVNLVSLPIAKPEPVIQPIVETPVEPIKPVAKTMTPAPKTEMKKLVQKTKPVTKPKAESKKKAVPKKPAPKKANVKKLVQNKTVKKAQPTKPITTSKKFTLDKPNNKPATKSVVEVNKKTKNQQAILGSSEPQLVSKPTFATKPSPVSYPRLAKRRGIEGTVLVEVLIGKDGKQLKQKLAKSSGASVLDKAALKAIKLWRFSPHIIDGKAIAHRVQIPVRFKLD